jgi:acyl dehydratase
VTVERFPVEEGAILLFARAVGDTNPVYSDAGYAATTEFGGVIAPPTFIQSSAHFDPDYPLRPKPGEPWFGSGATPTGRPAGGSSEESGTSKRGTGLHAEQEYEYHRPVRPGDVLRSETRPGQRWEKQGRSGKLVFSETITEYRDEKGELVVTARNVGVMTEAPVSRENR